MEQGKSTEHGREIVLRKRRRLKYIAVLPATVTLINAVCGFLSIAFASRGLQVFLQVSRFRRADLSFLALAGYMIIFAMIADMLDGQVARWSGAASSFGGQLDSLSDVISFGIAPAFLMLKVMEAALGVEVFSWRVSSAGEASLSWRLWLIAQAGRWLLFIALFYVLCAVIRLARFNVENDTDDAAHKSFAGLPSPAAAGVVVSLIIFRENFLPRISERLPALYEFLMGLTMWLLPLAALASGVLMVTRIYYPHAANRLFTGKKTFAPFVLLVFMCLLVVWNIQLGMVLCFWGFAIYGLGRALIGWIKNYRTKVRAKTV
ncbi:MAG: CDP-alcohol phosphatidyltransferase family protein [Spirochaetaceae bacterium]|jgi:CDP-diacylglycerol--serine O-phosphatidyltransferase|nr:CDP-alcohol phosphatidyltransferase family protein [Spirochaetaceae bacterium]